MRWLLLLLCCACTMSREAIDADIDRALVALEKRQTVNVTVPQPKVTVIKETVHVENPVDVDAILAAAVKSSLSALSKLSSVLKVLLEQAVAALSARIEKLETLHRTDPLAGLLLGRLEVAEKETAKSLAAVRADVVKLKARPTAVVDRSDFSKEQLARLHEIAGQIAEGKATTAIKDAESGYVQWLKEWAWALIVAVYGAEKSGALGRAAKALGLKKKAPA